MGLKIRLVGKPAIFDTQGGRKTVRGLQPWALLARILLSKRELSRRELAAELFPEAADPLGALRWCLASLRKALGSAQVLSGDPIKPNLPAGTDIDVYRLESGDFAADEAGDLLDSVEPRCSPGFATWLLVERERIAGLIDAQIRQEVMQAVSCGYYERAIRHAETGARRRPFDEGTHVLLVKSLALAGRYEAALEHVEATEKAFLAELGTKPSAALSNAARRTVSEPPGGVSPPAVVKSLLDSGRAALAAGAVDAGVDCLRRAAGDAEKCGDRRLRAQALLELGTALVHAVRGYDDEGAVALRQSVELAHQCADAQLTTAGLRELGYLEALAGRRSVAAVHLQKALAIATGPDSLAGIHAVIGFNLVDWGQTVAGLQHYDLSLEYARSAGNRRREAWSLGIGAWGQLSAGRPETAVRWADTCLAIVEDLRWVAFRPWPLAILGEARLRLKSEPRALQTGLEEAFALSCQIGDPCWEAATARVMALTYAAAADFAPALDWIGRARERCTRETDAYAALLVTILANHAEISLRAGQSAQADSIIRELLSLAARTHMDSYVQWAVERVCGGETGARVADLRGI